MRFAGYLRCMRHEIESVLLGIQGCLWKAFWKAVKAFWWVLKAFGGVQRLLGGFWSCLWEFWSCLGGFDLFCGGSKAGWRIQIAWGMPQPGNRQPLPSPLSRAAPAIFAPAHLPPTPRGQWAKSSACTSWAWAAWAFDEVTCANQQAGWETNGHCWNRLYAFWRQRACLGGCLAAPGICRSAWGTPQPRNRQPLLSVLRSMSAGENPTVFL